MTNYVHYQTGVRLFDEENYQAAISELQLYFDKEQHPEVDAYLYLGKALFLTEQYSLSIDQLTKFIGQSQTLNLPYAYDIMGQCYAALNEINRAQKCYQTATQMEPTCASAWHNWGLLCMTLAENNLEKNLQTGIELFLQAKQLLINSLTHFGHNHIFLNSIARWYERYVLVLEKIVDKKKEISSSYILAIQHYHEALNHCGKRNVAFKNIVTSNLIECLAQYGHHLYKLGNYRDALIQYIAVVDRDNAHIPALNQAGMCYFKQAQYQGARTWFSFIIERTKDAQDQADAWLNIACSYRLELNFDEAHVAITKAKKLAPTDPTIDEELNNIILASTNMLRGGAGM